VSQTAAQTVAADQTTAPPLIDYDLGQLTADDRPPGGNLTDHPAAKPADKAGFDPASDEGAMTVLGVALNGQELPGDTIVTVRGGRTLIPLDDAKRWRLRTSGDTVRIDDQLFVPLSNIPGLSFRIDKSLQQLQLIVPADSFERSTISGEPARLSPSEAIRTAFLNYDLSVQHGGRSTIGEAFVAVGASDDRGLVQSNFLASNGRTGHHLIRLETYLIHDDPSGPTRLTLGDSFTHIASWEQPVRFGGLKWGTDFSLQPGFISFPTPSFNGQAQLPSSVQLYVNNVLNYQGQVDQGPFSLNRLPLVSGAGDVSILVKDMLGVEHRVVSNYYISTNLLRPGLADFSVEAGAERRNFGLESFDYRRPFVAGSYRRGISSALTLEGRAEGSTGVQDIGGGFSTLLGKFAEIGVSGSVSNTKQGSGSLYRIFMARISQHWSFTALYQHNSRGYLQLGTSPQLQRPLETMQISGGANDVRFGDVTANISYLRLVDGSRTRVASLNYGRRIGKIGYFNAFVLRTSSNSGRPDTTAGVSLAMSWGPRTSAFVQIDHDNRSIDIQRNRPDDEGWSYRLSASQGKSDRQQAELGYRGRAIDLTADFERFDGHTDERLLASGGFILAGSSILPSRHLDSSFAIVEVGSGERNVRVYQENREVALTNRAGIAVVTNLRPYEANRISVSSTDLKLESIISNDNLVVVPRYLAGVKARFQVTNGRAGTVIIQMPNGDPLEPGLPVTTGDKTFYTGFDGELFIDDIVAGKVLVAKRDAGVCSVTLPAVRKDIELPRIGPLICRPVEQAPK
jgi:outer membrane usher protein